MAQLQRNNRKVKQGVGSRPYGEKRKLNAKKEANQQVLFYKAT